MMSQINLWSFMRVEFGFKQYSCLWEILMMGKNYNIVPFSMKANIQKPKWNFRMLSESCKLSSSKCSFFSDSGSEKNYVYSLMMHIHNYQGYLFMYKYQRSNESSGGDFCTSSIYVPPRYSTAWRTHMLYRISGVLKFSRFQRIRLSRYVDIHPYMLIYVHRCASLSLTPPPLTKETDRVMILFPYAIF